MNKRLILSLAASALVTSFAAGAFAAETQEQGQAAASQVDQRVQNQENKINAAEQSGQINANQAAKDQAHEQKISQEAGADEAKNGGALTKGEQKKLNNKLDKNSKKIHHQKAKNAKVAPTNASAPAAAPAAPASAAQ